MAKILIDTSIIIDSIIAATALIHQLTLATLNIKDFKNIKRIKLLPQKDVKILSNETAKNN